jgi:ABC-type branched-subunit amino acid transport system substrate-binding protein
MRRRAFALLAASVALSACVAPDTRRPVALPGAPSAAASPGLAPAPAGHGVAILLPLTGANAAVGQALLNSAQLAFAASGAKLDARDTMSTPAGASSAAGAAIAGGAGIILGPLTAAETAAAGPVATAAGVPILAFTNDPVQAKPGVWTLGITPAQQVQRLVVVAQAHGKSRFAALLPDTAYGHAMADALTQAAAALGAPTPSIATYAGGMGGINSAARSVSDYASRRGPIDAQARAARAAGTAEGRKQAAEIIKRGIPPAPFDALLFADTGDALAEAISLLSYYDIDPPAVKYLGPMSWGAVADQLARQSGMNGAWYPGPDPAARSDFVARYTAKYGDTPPFVADIGYDAATIAAALAAGPGFAGRTLTRPDGFAGIDGPLRLQPDGSVRRGLAVFELQRDGPVMIEPAAPPGASGT